MIAYRTSDCLRAYTCKRAHAISRQQPVREHARQTASVRMCSRSACGCSRQK
jgi:hypothetical protein